MPQLELGADPDAIARFICRAEELGFDELVIWDHVLGAHPERPGGWTGLYTHRSQFHEVFVLLGFAAALTRRIGLATTVLVLPQRQTALVAKQAMEIQLLTRGRLRLGVGVGWNPVEFEALGQQFTDRGRRIEEQIELMRSLWTEDVVTFRGKWHTVTLAGLNPRAPQRIPVWIGADADIGVRRAARIADGWCSHLRADDHLEEQVARFRSFVQEAGRDPREVEIEATIAAHAGDADEWQRWARRFRDCGVERIGFHTMDAGYPTLDEHLAAIERYRRIVDNL